jgi:hypothetical protein
MDTLLKCMIEKRLVMNKKNLHLNIEDSIKHISAIGPPEQWGKCRFKF